VTRAKIFLSPLFTAIGVATCPVHRVQYWWFTHPGRGRIQSTRSGIGSPVLGPIGVRLVQAGTLVSRYGY